MGKIAYKHFEFSVLLAEDDDLDNYAPGFPTVVVYEVDLEAAVVAARGCLEEGERLGGLLEEGS